MNLLLNWFRIEISPDTFRFPVKRFVDYAASTVALQDELREFSAYRPPKAALRASEGSSVVTVLFHGPTPPSDFNHNDFPAAAHPGLVWRIVKDSLASYWRNRDAIVVDNYFDVRILWVRETFDFGVRLLSGVTAKVHQSNENGSYGLVVNWTASAQFTASLADHDLRKHSVGLPVLFCPSPKARTVPPALRRRRRRFVGHVIEVVSDSKVRVAGYDRADHTIPADELFIEASPAVLYRLHERFNGTSDFRHIVDRIQELSYAMTTSRHRNKSVLQDRLTAIRQSLSPEDKETLTIPLTVYGGGSMFLELRPLAL